MTRHGIEPRSPGSLANTLPTGPNRNLITYEMLRVNYCRWWYNHKIVSWYYPLHLYSSKIARTKVENSWLITENFKIHLFIYILILLYLFYYVFFIKGFQTVVFIFIVISWTFWPICPPAFFRFLSNSGTYTELRITAFIESTGVACSDSVSYNRVQVLSIPALLLACSRDWTCNLQMIVFLEAERRIA